MQTTLPRTLAMAATLYAAALLLAALAHDRLLYPAPAPRQASFLGGETIAGRCGAVPASGQYMPPAEGAPTVVHFHGNAEQVADHAGLALRLSAHGLGSLFVEFPGYGTLAAADPSEQALIASSRCTLSVAQQRFGLTAGKTVLMGRSLGTGVAVALARQGWGARLVLLAPYTSIRELAASSLPWLPTSLLVRDPFESMTRARDIHLPTLVVHGQSDRVIPHSHGLRMAKTLGARLLTLNAGHNDLLAVGSARLIHDIASFAWPR